MATEPIYRGTCIVKYANIPFLVLGKVAAWIPSLFCTKELHIDFVVILPLGDDSVDQNRNVKTD